MTLAVTGHRPHKLNREWDGIGPVSDWIRKELASIVLDKKPDLLITGMALGVDQLFAELGIKLGIRVCAAIPCLEQDTRWSEKAKKRYHEILRNQLVIATYVTQVPYQGPWQMQRRNRWMVDQLADSADALIGVWDGSSGGTKNCLEYAEGKQVKVIHVDPTEIVAECELRQG